MAAEGSKQRRVSAPPRTLNVQKFAESRAAELQTLHSIVANRSNNDFRSRRNKRRRTTSHDNRLAKSNRYRKRPKLGGGGDGLGDNDVAPEKLPRRIRRRIELKKNPESGYCTSGDGTKRLRTHVWHAKRFTMTKLWGFHLPLVLQGSGRGSRALLKKFKDGVLTHDASYSGAIQLEGSESSLLQMLSTVLVSSQPSNSEHISDFVLSGAICGSVMLHLPGAPFSPAVAPVTYMWRPLRQQDADCHADGSNGQQGIEGSSFRQVLVWVHASAFSEAYDALKVACQKQMDETGSLINCISLQGKLAKLEIMGSKSFQLLRKVLHPVTSIADDSGKSCKFSHMGSDAKTSFRKIAILGNQHHTPSSITSLTVIDPRASSKEKVEHVPIEDSTSNLCNMREGEKLSALGGIPSENTELFSSSLLEPEDRGSALSDSMDLWDASKGILPPVEDNVHCIAKHQQKLDFFCLGNTNLGKQNASIGGQFCRFCPILLVNDSNKSGSIIRWSIILPLSWVKVFWVALISGGAHPIGLTEKHWIAHEAGLPYFPSGFPDCNAYSSFMANEAAALDEKMKLRPPAMRPVRIPIPTPWETVRFSFEKESSRGKDAETLSEKRCSLNMVNENENSVSKSDCQRSDILPLGHHGFMSDGFVARTSIMLNHFLGEIHGKHLLLFPESDLPDWKNVIDKFVKDDETLSPTPKGATALSNSGRRLCFLRVILHAYKGGNFEEGAVVCAPLYSDIESWISRLNNDREELQIPQSSVASYFEQKPSGKWELQVPVDPIAKESHRWPLGFVTSGFVRGSKKPCAEAICEATLLAELREEQWNATLVKQRRKEIYVLVRNLRSTAYRLALATIVLEQIKEDLEFM